MANYLVIGVGDQVGHALIVSATSREELFWTIDEHFNPYECVFHKIGGAFSFYFPVETKLEMETGLDNESFTEVSYTAPCLRQEPDSGDVVELLLIGWTEELWKQAYLDRRKLPKGVNLSSRWCCFKDREKTFVPYYLHEVLLNTIRASAKEIAEGSYRLGEGNQL